MKKIIATLILLSGFSVIANAGGLNQQNPAAMAAKFAEHKQKVLARIDEHRACVAAAQDNEQIKSCHTAHESQGRDGLFKGVGTDTLPTLPQ